MSRKIQGYTLIQCVGKGSSGQVFRAVNAYKQGQFAVKVIQNRLLAQNPKAQQCLVNQVNVLSKIGSCQNIVRFNQLIKTKNNHYFVYQFCNGGSLYDKLKKTKRIPQIQVLKYVKDILSAYKILNRYNVLHRDLKPENILFHNGKLKLADFGLCKDLKPQQHMTRTMIGSPIYMAPQVLKGQSYTSKADIWSLGVIIFEMLYGYCPYLQNSIASLVSKIQTSSLQLPQKPEVSANTKKFLKKMLTKDHFRRIGWVELFKQFLNIEQGVQTQDKNSGDYEQQSRKNSQKIVSLKTAKSRSKQKNAQRSGNNSKKTSLCYIEYASIPNQVTRQQKTHIQQKNSHQKQNRIQFTSAKYMSLLSSEQKQRQKQRKLLILSGDVTKTQQFKHNFNLISNTQPLYQRQNLNRDCANNDKNKNSLNICTKYNNSDIINSSSNINTNATKNFYNNHSNVIINRNNSDNFRNESARLRSKERDIGTKIDKNISTTKLSKNRNFFNNQSTPVHNIPSKRQIQKHSPSVQKYNENKIRTFVYKLQQLHSQFVKISPFCQNLLKTKLNDNINDVLEFLLLLKFKLIGFNTEFMKIKKSKFQQHQDIQTMIRYEIIRIQETIQQIYQFNGVKNYKFAILKNNYPSQAHEFKNIYLHQTCQRISLINV